ncbi:MAG: hypothetical protein HQL96_01460 [Magnetococcales bacterium]|nr:hypothetical protein [Magnetococcales bacterium]
MLLTLIVTRATLPDPAWETAITNRLGATWRAQIFFLDQGVRQVADARWSTLQPGGERIYCAHDHAQHHGPPPAPGILPGGLANLGRMIRESDYSLTLPKMHWPAQPGKQGVKPVVILLAADDPQNRLTEAARLAAGLAGCGHHVTLHSPVTPGPLFSLAAAPYLEALQALGGAIAPTSPEAPVILRL